MNYRLVSGLFVVLISILTPYPMGGSAVEVPRPLVIEGKKVLPLRVLARPFSNVYKEKDVKSGTVQENVPAFQSYYVYSRQLPGEVAEGWYEVGTDNRGTVIGWMRYDDVFEWKQTMCLTYTAPEERNPVLIFDKKQQLRDLIEEPSESRIQKADKYYSIINSKQLPENFPVLSVEPRKDIDIKKQFYLLPILDFEKIKIEGRQGRLLELAAVTSAGPGARDKSDIRQNEGFLSQAVTGATETTPEVLKKLNIDLVWVMDTTLSMSPYIKKSLEVVKSVSEKISANPEISDSIHFGFWGYRDSVAEVPELEYTTRSYTQTLQTINQFVETLQMVQATEADSIDWPEDVFSGIRDAIENTPWTPEAIRLVILIGDAPGHDFGHKHNVSGLDVKALRERVDNKKVHILSIFIKDPRAQKYHEIGKDQFSNLSRNRGPMSDPPYYEINSGDLDGFSQVSNLLPEAVKNVMVAAKGGEVYKRDLASADKKTAQLDNESEISPDKWLIFSDDDEKEREIAQKVNDVLNDSGKEPSVGQETEKQPENDKLAYKMIHAALVEWVGSQTDAKAPRDIVGWAIDKDLHNPHIDSMEVRLLINKTQLDSLQKMLEQIIDAGKKGEKSAGDFFTALQATVATLAREPDQIRNAQNFAETGLVPEFLIGLPYESRLMKTKKDEWNRFGFDRQSELMISVEKAINHYKEIHDSPDGWIALNKGDDPDEQVYPIKLDDLP